MGQYEDNQLLRITVEVLERQIDGLGDIPLIQAQGGFHNIDRARRVINKLQTENEKLREVLEKRIVHRETSCYFQFGSCLESSRERHKILHKPSCILAKGLHDG